MRNDKVTDITLVLLIYFQLLDQKLDFVKRDYPLLLISLLHHRGQYIVVYLGLRLNSSYPIVIF
jgi:hypothetical protein